MSLCGNEEGRKKQKKTYTLNVTSSGAHTERTKLAAEA